MDYQQLSAEIRELNDANDRQVIFLEALESKTRHLEERSIPASTADIRHTISGVSELLAGLAATVHKLASQVYAVDDRLTLIERVIDQDLPPDGSGP